VKHAQFTFKDGRVFAVAEPRAWNSLPDAICRSPSLAIFNVLQKLAYSLNAFTMAALRIADADIIFCSCGFYLSSSFFPGLIFSAVADWM